MLFITYGRKPYAIKIITIRTKVYIVNGLFMLFYEFLCPNILNRIIPTVTIQAINICLFSTLKFYEALEKNTATNTTDNKSQQLNKLTVVNEIKIIAKFINICINTSIEASLANYLNGI